MPLRDHFRPPIDDVHSWDGLHGMLPAMIIQSLNKYLPESYFAAPTVHIGHLFQVDVGTYEEPEATVHPNDSGNGGVALATYAPPKATLVAEPSMPDHDMYEVRIYASGRSRRLVAAIEIVSPSNKDRPETRGTFISMAAELLRQDVCVSIVDVVTTSQFNLCGELLSFLDVSDPAVNDEPPPIYAATLRMRQEGDRRLMDCWYDALTIGEALPTLPIWLKETWAIPLELEAIYEETCRTLRIR